MTVDRSFSVVVDFDDGNLALWEGLSEIGYASGVMEIDVRERNYSVVPAPPRAIRDGTATLVDSSGNVATITGAALEDFFFELNDNGAASTVVLPYTLDFSGQGLTNVPAFLRFDLGSEQGAGGQSTVQDISPVNGDAEDGTTGWVQRVALGTLTTQSASPAPVQGSAYFASLEGTNVFYDNEKAIPSEYWNDIDSGTAFIDLTWQQYGDGIDEAYVTIDMLDADGARIELEDPGSTAETGWVERSFLDVPVPPGTRFLVYGITLFDGNGDSSNLAYIDDIQASLKTVTDLAIIDPVRVRLYGLTVDNTPPTTPPVDPPVDPPGPTEPPIPPDIELELGKIIVNDPKIVALQEELDVRRNANTMMRNLSDFRYVIVVDKIIPLGERSIYKTVNDDGTLQYFNITDDSPGLRDGRIGILTGFDARDARSNAPVTLTFRCN